MAIPKTTIEIKHEHSVTSRTPDWIDSITLATPILTFLAGYYLNQLVENYKERQRLNQVEKYYFSLLNTLVGTMRKQADAIDRAAVAQEELRGPMLLIARFPALQTSRITAIPDMDLYKAFILRRKDVEANNTQLTIVAGAVDFVSNAIGKIQGFNQEFFDRNVAFSKTINEGMLAILDAKNALVSEVTDKGLERTPETDFIVRSFGKHMRVHQEKNGHQALAEPIEIYTNLVAPLYEDMRTIEPTDRVHPLMRLIDICYVEFIRFFSFRDAHVAQIRSLGTSLRDSATIINDAVVVLQAAR